MTDLEKLCLRVTEAADCAVITDDVNRRYFTAMKSSAGTLVVFPEKAYFIIDFRYIEKAKKTVTACEVILQDKLYEQINSLIEKAKRNLDREVNNESLIGLSRLQDSLTYFQTSIRGNENLLAKLKFKLQVDELDADLIEDVNIEMSQARETTSIYSDILESTMDTYSSIINNNMNTVMRTLTSVSIILMFPTLIASLLGMNLINGMENNKYGFLIALVASVMISGVSWWIFRHKRLI